MDLSDEMISKLLKEAEENKAEDDKLLRRQNAIRQAEEILGDANRRKMYNGNKLEELLAELGLSIQNNDPVTINSKTKELEDLLSSQNVFAGFGDIFGDFFGTKAQKPYKAQGYRNTAPPQDRESVPFNKAVKDERPKAEPMKYDIGKIFGSYSFTLDPNLCFVLMPFSKTMDPIYTDHIKPIVESEGITCQRADEIVGTNIITFDIWEKINRSRFMVADLTGRNPNVFYEIGLAHALGKDVIIITQTMNDVPFDLKALRCIVYDFTPRGMKQLEVSLVKTIKTIMRSS